MTGPSPGSIGASAPVALLGRLETARGSLRRFRTYEGLVWTGLAALGVAWAAVAADWLWVLETPLRGALLIAGVAVAVVMVVRRVIAPARAVRRDDAAVEVEAGFPALGQRVRTALEYADPTERTSPAAPGLVDALEADAEERTCGLDLDTIVPWSRLRRRRRPWRSAC